MVITEIVEAMKNLESMIDLGTSTTPAKSVSYLFDCSKSEEKYCKIKKHFHSAIEESIKLDLSNHKRYQKYKNSDSEYAVKNYSEIINVPNKNLWFHFNKYQISHSDKLLMELVDESLNGNGYDDRTFCLAGKITLNLYEDHFSPLLNLLERYMKANQ